jgi:hypothetical protein
MSNALSPDSSNELMFGFTGSINMVLISVWVVLVCDVLIRRQARIIVRVIYA